MPPLSPPAGADAALFEDIRRTLEVEIEAHPTWPDLRLKAGLASLELGDAAAAKRSLLVALELNPRYIDAHIALAFAESEAGRRETASAAVARLLETEAAEPSGLLARAALAVRAGDLVAARVSFAAAACARPQWWLARVAEALVAERLGATADAAALLAATRRDLPELDRHLADRGLDPSASRLLAARGDLLSGNPLRGSIYRHASSHAAGQDDVGRAVSLLERALDLDLRFGIHEAALGDLSFARDHTEEAVLRFRAALALNPELSKPRATLAHALGILGRLEEALAVLEEAVRLRPSYPDLHYQLGTLRLDRGERARARVSFGRALELNPRYAAANFSLGLVRYEDGDLGGAAASFQAARGGVIPEAEVLSRIGFCRLGLGAVDEAERLFREASALEPSLGAAAIGIALACERRSDLAGARAACERFFAAGAADAEAEHLAAAKELAGRLGLPIPAQ